MIGNELTSPANKVFQINSPLLFMHHKKPSEEEKIIFSPSPTTPEVKVISSFFSHNLSPVLLSNFFIVPSDVATYRKSSA